MFVHMNFTRCNPKATELDLTAVKLKRYRDMPADHMRISTLL